jgi:hypothetical protein
MVYLFMPQYDGLWNPTWSLRWQCYQFGDSRSQETGDVEISSSRSFDWEINHAKGNTAHHRAE